MNTPAKILLPLVPSAICALILYLLASNIPVLSTWFGLVADTSPETYMISYYNKENTLHSSPDEYEDIVILDVREDMTRKDIGDLLQFVATCSPRVVGVDITFSTSHSFDQSQTEYLIHSIDQLPDAFPIVFAQVASEESAIPDAILRRRHVGVVNFLGFYDYKAQMDALPHIAVEMARLAGYNVDVIDTSSFLVNYRVKSFPACQIYSDFMNPADQAYIRQFITNKIVLIGGLTDALDTHQAPFYINNKGDLIAGTTIVAYVLSSIISATQPKALARPYTYNPYYHHYARLSWWANAIWSTLFVFIYLLVYHSINRLQKRNKWVAIFKPVWLVLTIICVLLLSMAITARCFLVPDIVFFMIMTAFVGFWYDVINMS